LQYIKKISSRSSAAYQAVIQRSRLQIALVR